MIALRCTCISSAFIPKAGWLGSIGEPGRPAGGGGGGVGGGGDPVKAESLSAMSVAAPNSGEGGGMSMERLLPCSSMSSGAVSYTHLRAHETPEHLVCRLLLEKKKSDLK